MKCLVYGQLWIIDVNRLVGENHTVDGFLNVEDEQNMSLLSISVFKQNEIL